MARFASVGAAECENILKGMNSANTHHSAIGAWNIFINYLKEKEINVDPAIILKENLNDILKQFYVEVRQSDGRLYRKSSLSSIRFGLQRKFKEIKMDLDIISDPAFMEANTIFKAQCIQLKQKDMAKVDHKPPITPEDISKLYENGVFARYNEKCFSKLCYSSVVVGRENLRNLIRDCFVIKKDGNGVEKVINEI